MLEFIRNQSSELKRQVGEALRDLQRLREVVNGEVYRTSKVVTVRTAEQLGEALGLSVADTAEMEFRSELTVALSSIIQSGKLSHADIAKRAGTSRTRVTAIANGNTHGVSTDVLIRVLAATGHRAELRVRKAAA